VRFHKLRTCGEAPSPGLLRNPTSPRKRGEVDAAIHNLIITNANYGCSASMRVRLQRLLGQLVERADLGAGES